ncbi:MAG: hypothetical protein JRI25_29875, partial [Deltaproteobacteria bacterium]|nr:hypothetical protein [Deltaproteobacteria bacterium]
MHLLFVLALASCGSDERSLKRPNDVVLSPDGRVFVSDLHHKRIVVFDAEGRWVDGIGTPGLGKGQLWDPWELVFVPPDRLVVIQERYETMIGSESYWEVKEFDEGQEVVAKRLVWEGGRDVAWVESLARAPDGNWWIPDTDRGPRPRAQLRPGLDLPGRRVRPGGGGGDALADRRPVGRGERVGGRAEAPSVAPLRSSRGAEGLLRRAGCRGRADVLPHVPGRVPRGVGRGGGLREPPCAALRPPGTVDRRLLPGAGRARRPGATHGARRLLGLRAALPGRLQGLPGPGHPAHGGGAAGALHLVSSPLGVRSGPAIWRVSPLAHRSGEIRCVAADHDGERRGSEHERDEHLGSLHVLLVGRTEEVDVLPLLDLGGRYEENGRGDGQGARHPGGVLEENPPGQ